MRKGLSPTEMVEKGPCQDFISEKFKIIFRSHKEDGVFLIKEG